MSSYICSVNTFKSITKTIWIISLVSLFTDFASEMLYPVMPVYLKSIGYSVMVIGVLEGFAEAVAGLGKSYFGRLSDASGKRLPFVRLGYFLSAVSKPMIALSTQVWWIFSARFIDRAGKGLRTAPRDALLSDETDASNKATVFGFHRAMDTFGAVLGPLTALLFLFYYPGQYKFLFYIAFVPGVVAIVFTFLVKDKKTEHTPRKAIAFHQTFSYWKESSVDYKKLVASLLLFALFNSSDVFLLLKMKEAGIPDTTVIAVYIFYNLVFALLAFPIGRMADRIGMKKIFLAGLIFFVITYTGFAFPANNSFFWVYFFCYGIYAAATDGVSKAWISNITPKTETASAIGLYTGLQSVAILIASSAAGFIWVQLGSSFVFLSAAVVALFSFTWILRSFRS